MGKASVFQNSEVFFCANLPPIFLLLLLCCGVTHTRIRVWMHPSATSQAVTVPVKWSIRELGLQEPLSQGIIARRSCRWMKGPFGELWAAFRQQHLRDFLIRVRGYFAADEYIRCNFNGARTLKIKCGFWKKSFLSWIHCAPCLPAEIIPLLGYAEG